MHIDLVELTVDADIDIDTDVGRGILPNIPNQIKPRNSCPREVTTCN